ncbi:nif domain-containing protein [Diplodia corticola]|uniref:Nif domain-containing protein n=1 Tax=Diplodia corticola TaxID=236234 RepID=A0A1J9QYV2_9PEZI|nr:nif domain-containing protein [Diplodia corticola]OJD33584.1 nif domain-containing protein [Diplodia corticola]
MNSLNILSAIGSTPPPSPPRSRAGSESDITKPGRPSHTRGRSYTEDVQRGVGAAFAEKGLGLSLDDSQANEEDAPPDEKTPLIAQDEPESISTSKSWSVWMIPKRIATAAVGGVRAVFAAVIAPVHYLATCFYDDDGNFSALLPLYRLARMIPRKKRSRSVHGMDYDDTNKRNDDRFDRRTGKLLRKSSRRSPSVSSTTSSVAMTSDSESERPSTRDEDSPARHTRSKSSVDEIAPARRSIRIKLHNEDTLRKRKQRTGSTSSKASGGLTPHEAAAAAVKSPGSPGSASKLKFPRAPVPPRPLVPRRQPSYSGRHAPPNFGPHEKTLILDLDETLIHSMAKGGRYTTGHMVEVKLNQTVGSGNQVYGPQVPILYYVHKRPHCDDFLRKVSKWYNLIIFTASVQEYADPVIDWLELERKYFAGRYYRQHCTFRNGAYIKDLSQVEPDLSKVMIVDNSPMSYIFHEGNAPTYQALDEYSFVNFTPTTQTTRSR